MDLDIPLQYWSEEVRVLKECVEWKPDRYPKTRKVCLVLFAGPMVIMLNAVRQAREDEASRSALKGEQEVERPEPEHREGPDPSERPSVPAIPPEFERIEKAREEKGQNQEDESLEEDE
jgi:hypothetical protein